MLHTKWKSLRHRQNLNIDERMAILPGIFPVGCKLATESAPYAAEDGLQAVDEALSKQAVVISRVPPSWVAARWVARIQSSRLSNAEALRAFVCFLPPEGSAGFQLFHGILCLNEVLK